MATAAPKPKALSLHIGVNTVNPAYYAGWDGPLNACEFDANDMAALATAQGMKPTLLLTKNATRSKVLAALRAAAKALKKGDLFFLSFSGHGGQMPDVDGEEEDGRDETLCLYDGQLLDDELYLEFTGFAAGVRILMLSDSCHSGTVTKNGPIGQLGPFTTIGPKPRWMPFSIGERVYREHKAFYDKLQRDTTAAAGGRSIDPDEALASVNVSGRVSGVAKQMKASAILVSGCQDNQSSFDGEHNGAFTEALLAVWNQGKFKGNYTQMHARTRARLPAVQTPNLFTLGPVKSFLTQKPFAL